MSKSPLLRMIPLCLWSLWYLYFNLTMTLDDQVNMLSASLNSLSWEIKDIRNQATEINKLADQKEHKFNTLLSQLLNSKVNEAKVDKANDSKPIVGDTLVSYNCILQDNTIWEMQYPEKDMIYKSDCNAFENVNGCWINSKTEDNCFKQ